MELKKIITIAFIVVAPAAIAEIQNCGTVNISEILTGPRHEAMIRVSNYDCGNNGYICIDLSGNFASKEVSQFTQSFILAKHLAGESIKVYVDTANTGCNYSAPFIQDARG